MSVLKSIIDHLPSTGRCGALAAGVLVATSVGCYRPYYYSPPFPTYQGPTAPIQTLTPGPSYVPGQGVPGGLAPIPSDSLGAPANGFGGSDPFYSGSTGTNSSPPSSTFDNSSTQPTYDPNPVTPNNTVPDYPDPGGVDGFDDFLQPNRTDGNGPVDSFKVPAGEPQAMIPPSTLTPVSEVTDASLRDPLEFSLDQQEVAPIDLSTPLEIEQTSYMPETIGETTLDPYAHEEGTYAWLRGVVERDLEDGSWTITYDLTPDEFDPFGGHFTLAADPRLENLTNDDVVLLEGRVDDSATDRLGKSVYVVTEVIPLDVSVR